MLKDARERQGGFGLQRAIKWISFVDAFELNQGPLTHRAGLIINACHGPQLNLGAHVTGQCHRRHFFGVDGPLAHARLKITAEKWLRVRSDASFDRIVQRARARDGRNADC